MNIHYHTSIDQILLGAITVALAFHVARWGAGAMAKSNNPTFSSAGKAVGALFTFA